MSLLDRVTSFYSSKGRANRKEYWTWFAVSACAFVATIVFATLFGDNGVYDEPGVSRPLRLALIAIPGLSMLGLAIKMRAVSIRRRHDTDVGERYRHIRWIPFVGRYAHFAMLGFLPSTRSGNVHGEGPGTSAIIDVFAEGGGRSNRPPGSPDV